MSVRVLVADDHPLFRSGLSTALGLAAGIEVVGEACDGDEAVRLAVALRPAVVLMDLDMPLLDGVEATRRIREADPSCGVLVLTMAEDDDSLFAALRAGAQGYLLKGAEAEEIVRAVEAVVAGEAVFGASVAQRVLAALAGAPRPEPFPSLTAREREILEQLAEGRPNPEIARALAVTEKTVRNSVSRILGKLELHSRAQAVARAREAGLGVRRAT